MPFRSFVASLLFIFGVQAQAATIEYTFTGATSVVTFANHPPLFAPVGQGNAAGSFTISDDSGSLVVTSDMEPNMGLGLIQMFGPDIIHLLPTTTLVGTDLSGLTDLGSFRPTSFGLFTTYLSAPTVLDPQGRRYVNGISEIFDLTNATITTRVVPDMPAVPLPATAPLLGGALALSLLALRRRRRA